ncbi:AAA family ATPase [Mucilaginibacter sp. UR6-1]|uniref:AAA family ATPase n=1 Tax=Mucilaginibacter sp. UR6-1 TaxID=1435643 RepID=UPI001E431EEF|nr:AAA family ATPase [Mucilaginibacter sp. UR6-1]MCC8408464.1 AAA family ATPase [Mucilaginibacter sp. UR6-1]
MIVKVDIKGYKSIKEQSIELRPINILIGSNGVGKSNFISIFSLIRNLYEQNLQNYILQKGGADSFLYFGKKQTQQIDLDFYFGENGHAKNRFIVSFGVAQDSLFIKKLNTAYLPQVNWYVREYESGKTESNIRNINHNQAYWVNPLLRAFEVYHFHDTGDNSPMKGRSNIDDNIRLKRDGSNIAAFLYYLKQKHPKHFNRIERTIKSIAPFFDRFVLAPNRLKEDQIQLEWREVGAPDTYFNAYHLSDGTLRFICLATLLMQPNPPKTIIIDEPELGLHPIAISKLASLIRKASEDVQIIVSSQSVYLVDYFEPEDILIADRKEKETVFQRLESNQLDGWLQEYSLGEVWEKNIIGGMPSNM